MEEQLRAIRRGIDLLSQHTEYVLSSVTKESVTKESVNMKAENRMRVFHMLSMYEYNILMAKGWLGKLTGIATGTTPYKKDEDRKEVKDIDPTDDNPELDLQSISFRAWQMDNTVTKIGHLRRWIKGYFEQIQNLQVTIERQINVGESRSAAICRTNAETSIEEASMCLGFVLGLLRDSDNS